MKQVCERDLHGVRKIRRGVSLKILSKEKKRWLETTLPQNLRGSRIAGRSEGGYGVKGIYAIQKK